MNRIKLVVISCLILFSMPLFAQQVTLNEKGSRLKDVLEKIAKQTSFDLFYPTEILKKTNRVSIKVNKEELATVLKKIFDEQPISFAISNQTIVLIPKRPTIRQSLIEINVDPQIINQSQGLVNGRIVDPNGNPIQGVTIVNNKDPQKFAAISDRNGDFAIEASKGDLLSFTSQGFKENTYFYNGEKRLNLTLYNKVFEVSEVSIEANVKKKLNLNTEIDLTNRSYMNLGQILQGTVPGLTLQILPTNKRKVVGVTEITGGKIEGEGLRKTYYTIEQFLQKFYPHGDRMISAIENNTPLPGGSRSNIFYLEYSNQASVTLVPELRGSATFGNTEGMMVVIDGFPVDEFPADYPMANVEAVEVVKDPKELIKWGPRATAGIILIKTKNGKRNKVNITYNTNMYYKPAPEYNMSKLGLATSADIIDYYKSATDSNFMNGDGNFEQIELAERLVYWYGKGKITKETYERRMDSLATISNQDQVGLLQQDVFSQNHLLTLSGGSRVYKFTLTGTYNNYKSNALNNNSNTYGVDLKNNFLLLGGKLRATWQMNANLMEGQAGSNSLSIYNLPPPYQKFLDANGNYVYDQTVLGEENNNLIMSKGYYNHGSNMLEDSRLAYNALHGLQLQSRLDMNWEIAKGLRWDNAIFFRRKSDRSTNITDRNSSAARQLFNTYGSPTANGVDFYVPPGDMLNESNRINQQINVRSGISYSYTIDKHEISAQVGAGGADELREMPGNATRYGYNRATGQGSPIFLPAGDPSDGITNFRRLYSSTSALAFPNTLIHPFAGDTTIQRNLNWNAGINYNFDKKRVVFNANYNEAFSPNYGMAKYATTKSYNALLGYQIRTKSLPKWVDGILLSTGLSVNKMPDLPTTIGSNRYKQTDWNNYAIWVNNFIPVQQAGQSSNKIYQEVRLDLLEGQLALYGRFNHLKTNGIAVNGSLTDSTSFHQTRTQNYFSVGAEGSLREGALMFNADYDRSPEGQDQFNGNISYDIKKEYYFTSEYISSLLIGASYQDISSFQGLNLMMGTNVASGGGFGMPTNNTFSILPPRNRNIEVYLQMGMNNDRYRLDLRYYNRSDKGISNNIALPTDPSTGLDNQFSLSNIVNKGLEFYLKMNLVNQPKFRYSFAINGAYNVNMAKEVPKTPYSPYRDYLIAYREGYNTTNVWAYRWAGLDANGAPQIYDAKGNITSTPDSTVLANDLVYMGATRAPWNGGFIHDFAYGNVFARVSILGSFGGIMRKYIPISSGARYENSHLIGQRWRKPGDEAFTDVPALSMETSNSIRSYITQNSTNSFMSADFVRLQEVMIGWQLPRGLINERYVKNASISAHMQNLALWAKNQYKYDPNNVDNSGRLGLPTPIQYGMTLNVTF